PADERLTRSVDRVRRSSTSTSSAPLVSPWTSVEADEAKATQRPSALMAGVKLAPSASRPSTASEIRLGPPFPPPAAPTAARATGGSAPNISPATTSRPATIPLLRCATVRPPGALPEAADATPLSLRVQRLFVQMALNVRFAEEGVTE